MLLTEDWKIVKTLGSIILDRIQTGMKIFPASLIATALLQQPEGFQFGRWVWKCIVPSALAMYGSVQ